MGTLGDRRERTRETCEAIAGHSPSLTWGSSASALWTFGTGKFSVVCGGGESWALWHPWPLLKMTEISAATAKCHVGRESPLVENQ